MGGKLLATIPVGPLSCNCSIVVDEESRRAAVVDPGDDAEEILSALARMDARPVVLLHTHGHFDHIAGARRIHDATGAEIALHPADRFLYDGLQEQGRLFGMAFDAPAAVDRELSDGEEVPFGGSSIRVLHTPGHSPGSCAFLLESADRVLFSGDTLFSGSVGRTDLWGGSFDTLAASIREKLYCLPPELRVVPGHGEETTIGKERASNPFVR
jgi:glyoxylase-like metal-dependent hydrolase (beta-lactamase superfamily II)